MAKRLKCAKWFDAKGVTAAVREASRTPQMRMALAIERDAKISMEKGGVVKRRSKIRQRDKAGRRRFLNVTEHVPSKPGDPPHVQTGVGRSSIRTGWIDGRNVAIVGPASPPASYMAIHEFGGRFHPPRPFMVPALLRMKSEYPKYFRKLGLTRTLSGRALERKAKRFRNRHGGKT
jgi:hypothetical protein